MTKKIYIVSEGFDYEGENVVFVSMDIDEAKKQFYSNDTESRSVDFVVLSVMEFDKRGRVTEIMSRSVL